MSCSICLSDRRQHPFIRTHTHTHTFLLTLEQYIDSSVEYHMFDHILIAPDSINQIWLTVTEEDLTSSGLNLPRSKDDAASAFQAHSAAHLSNKCSSWIFLIENDSGVLSHKRTQSDTCHGYLGRVNLTKTCTGLIVPLNQKRKKKWIIFWIEKIKLMFGIGLPLTTIFTSINLPINLQMNRLI